MCISCFVDLSMQKRPLNGSTFSRLFDAIIAKANALLVEEGLQDRNEEGLHRNMMQKRLIGYDTYQRTDQRKILNPEDRQKTIYAALYLFCQRPENKDLQERSDLPPAAGLNPRVLSDACAQYKKYEKGELEYILINEKYLLLFLHFIGYENYDDFARDQLSDPDEGDTVPRYHYRCCYFSNDFQTVKRFDATFTGLIGDSTKMNVLFHNGEISAPYEGSIEVDTKEREAVITAWTKTERPQPERMSRPLIITITKQSEIRFHLLKVCVGYYMNPGEENLENSCGIILFEQLENKTDESQLTDKHVRHFLMHPPESLPNGGFRTLDDFLDTYYEPYKEVIGLSELFADRHYQAFLLSKKTNGSTMSGNDYVELSKFECYSPYRIRCMSNYATKTTFEGVVSFFLPNRIQIRMKGQKDSHYQLLLEIPPEGLASEAPLRGVYSGMTQNGNIAAGRVLLKPVSKEAFDQIPMNISPLKSPEVQNWVETYDLDQFFAGKLDDFVDNSQAFQSQIASIFEGSTDFSHLPGVYYYYRTRTIRGHMREIKRFPMILYPDGKVIVKIKAGGKYEEAHGTAIRIKKCIYIHLKKQDRYDGLAILWPPSLDNVSPNDEIIPALYVSNSKRFHITAGRLFFIRQFEECPDEELFERLMPSNINMDDPEVLARLSSKELTTTSILIGQLNNYLAVRSATEFNLPRFADSIFDGACLQAQSGQFPEAYETLYLALLRAGYRDTEVLIQAFTTGTFAGHESKFKHYCKAKYDLIHGEDQRKYLKALFTEIFPNNSPK